MPHCRTCLHFVSVTGCRSHFLSKSSEGVEPECADEHGTTLLSEACAGNAKALKRMQICKSVSVYDCYHCNPHTCSSSICELFLPTQDWTWLLGAGDSLSLSLFFRILSHLNAPWFSRQMCEKGWDIHESSCHRKLSRCCWGKPASLGWFVASYGWLTQFLIIFAVHAMLKQHDARAFVECRFLSLVSSGWCSFFPPEVKTIVGIPFDGFCCNFVIGTGFRTGLASGSQCHRPLSSIPSVASSLCWKWGAHSHAAA